MAEIKMTKHAFGAKENIEAAKTAGSIDAYDVLHLSNGELAWIDAQGETVINTPRTQTDIVVNGVTGLGIGNGETIQAGKSIDEIVKLLKLMKVLFSNSSPLSFNYSYNYVKNQCF